VTRTPPLAFLRTTACAALLLSSHACREATNDPAILSLSGEEVRWSEFQAHIADLGRRGHEVDAELRQALLQPFLEERVLVLEARARGLVEAGATPDAEKAAVEGLLAQALPVPRIDDAEVKRYYEDHLDEFRRKPGVTLRQILLPTDNEARDVRRRLQRDPKSFEILARSRSRSPEASTGGLMGNFEAGELPAELETAAFNLPVGATSEIIPTPLGYHVLRVDARSEAREEPFEECGPRIRAQLVRARVDESHRAFVAQLLSRAKVNHEIALRLDQP
jgi:peptidyl-prolyl cis-trans isomerase C